MLGKDIESNNNIKPNSRELTQLKDNFPQFFNKEGQFKMKDFLDVLNQDEIDISKERYGLNFLGKSYARYQSSLETETFISPDTEHNNKEENKDSNNIYITGDNLDALKHLLKSYSGKIDFIYIDPPYNTKNKDFIYPDNFEFNSEEIAKLMDITEDEAERILNLAGKSTHSAWLTFMYPRLVLARDLLSNEGVIFVSIDDHEQANLKLLMDDIFGEGNFVADLIRKTKSTTNDANTGINLQHENCLVYSKHKNKISLLGREKNLEKYSNPDDDPNGDWVSSDPSAKSGSMENNCFAVVNPYTGKEDYPPAGRYWAFSENTLQKHIDNGTISFKKDHKHDERGFLYKRYKKNLRTTKKTLDSLRFTKNEFMNQAATKELLDLDLVEYFTFPKGTEYIEQMLVHGTTKNSTILDFFAGSSTTADAVMQLNAKDGGERQYIMVQLSEKIKKDHVAYKAGFRTIDEIGRERIKRAADKIKNESDKHIDYGFKLYHLTEPSDKLVEDILSFKPETELIRDNYISMFDTTYASGRDNILTTWLNKDGFGLTCSPQDYKLNHYIGQLIGKKLYIVDEGLESEDVVELIKRIELSELDLNAVVIYSHVVEVKPLLELRRNLSNLGQNKNVSLIERF